MLAYTVPEESQALSQKITCSPNSTSSPPVLRRGEGPANAGTPLPRVQVGLVADDSLRLLDSLLGLGQDELDMAGARHVRVDLSPC